MEHRELVKSKDISDKGLKAMDESVANLKKRKGVRTNRFIRLLDEIVFKKIASFVNVKIYTYKNPLSLIEI